MNSIEIYKFGGASVKSADAIRNIKHVIQTQGPDRLLVVISAMGKMTNAFEKLLETFLSKDDYRTIFEEIKTFHKTICNELFSDNDPLFKKLEDLFVTLENYLKEDLSQTHKDQIYDQVVSFGELLSTTIVQAYLENEGVNSKWIDARQYIHTDDNWRASKVNMETTAQKIQKELSPILENQIIITQGFLGGNAGHTTTLGREGSDYSASIFAASLEASATTIWKDVPGILNADPKRLADTQLFDQLTYEEAAKMTFFGASVIHPKTIKPLADKSIPLYVRSFVKPEANGTCISMKGSDKQLPSVIFKDGLALLYIKTQALEFFDAHDTANIANALASLDLPLYLLDNDAFETRICTEDFSTDLSKQHQIEKMLCNYKISLTKDIKLTTFLHADEAFIRNIMKDVKVVCSQSTDTILKFVS